MKFFTSFLALLSLISTLHAQTLWYKQPAEKWAYEALPIGNGRMGAMLFGGVHGERIQFNEDSLWGGKNNWDGDYDESDTGFGGYRNFGDLFIYWDHKRSPELSSPSGHAAGNGQATLPADYRRSLDISNGIHQVSFTNKDGIKITREAFASHPDQVIVFRYTADKPGAFSGLIQLKPGQTGATIDTNPQGMTFTGKLMNDLNYAAHFRILHDGGKLTPHADGSLSMSGCDSITILLAARTDYKMSYADDWRGELPLPQVLKDTIKAEKKSYATLRASHIADLGGLLGNNTIHLGKSTPEQNALPTDVRTARYVDNGTFGTHQPDPELNVMIYQMGRYLLASSSRPGGLPANLQGLWNDSNRPAWASDYHNNINIQMNYWPAETTGLGETALPLIDYVISQAEPLRIATRKAFGQNVRGWTARTSQSPFGGSGWKWNIPASAWYALHAFDHWDFTRDEVYLRDKCYPMLKEICQYWEDRLKSLPDGSLVAPNGWSPEHGPEEDGVMHDQQLIWELFDDYLVAAKALGVDADYQAKVAEMQKKLAPNKIGKWGQLQEWQTDRDDPRNNHRHTSHLFAVYPGRQISPTLTPDLAKAARFSLLARSNDSDDGRKSWTPANMHPESIYSWVWPWRAAMWARLGEAERAYALVWGSAGNTAPNMMDSYAPYHRAKHGGQLIQLDGSFGITAAIAEMLIQSHAGEITLLPALPDAWAKQGSFKGLRARGGHRVDATWKDGKVTHFKITSKSPTKIKVTVNGKSQDFTTEKLVE